jgi:hypothetical protein
MLVPTSREIPNGIKIAIGGHLANRCDVCATSGRPTFIGGLASPWRGAAGSKIFFAAQSWRGGPARQRMRQARLQDAYQSFPDEAARALYRSMDSCSNYPA